MSQPPLRVSSVALATALLVLPLAACKQADPQRDHAYEELTGSAAADTSAEAVEHALEAPTGADAPHTTAEAVAQYDVAATAPQPNLNTQAMRGMPLPDTATKGWAAKGKERRQHSESEAAH